MQTTCIWNVQKTLKTHIKINNLIRKHTKHMKGYFIYKGHTDSKEAYEKLFSIISHLEGANYTFTAFELICEVINFIVLFLNSKTYLCLQIMVRLWAFQHHKNLFQLPKRQLCSYSGFLHIVFFFLRGSQKFRF